jgi:putative membrane protein
MAYDNLDGDQQLILRDYMAGQRTHLANERTLLAYLHSALMMLVAALTIFKLFESDLIMRIVALILCPISIFIGAFGIYRFRQIRAKLVLFEKAPVAKKATTELVHEKSY